MNAFYIYSHTLASYPPPPPYGYSHDYFSLLKKHSFPLPLWGEPQKCLACTPLREEMRNSFYIDKYKWLLFTPVRGVTNNFHINTYKCWFPFPRRRGSHKHLPHPHTLMRRQRRTPSTSLRTHMRLLPPLWG